MRKRLLASCAAALTLMTASPAQAQQDTAADVQQLRASLLILVRTLLDQNLLTVAKAQEMLRQAGIDPAALTAAAMPSAAPPVAAVAAPPAPPVVRVPYVPETVKRELREEIRQEVLATARAERWGVPEALPSWLSRFTFSGDVRLRLQSDGFDDGNGSPRDVDTFYQATDVNGQPTLTANTTESRQRLRVRARLGVVARVSDEVQAGLRIVTSGSSNDPASTNVDAGQYQRRYGLALDQAYIGWGLGPYSVAGGRIANPYQTSDLLWSNDLTLDGVAASWRPNLGYEWSAYTTLGVHPLREVNNSQFNRASDSWLVGVQAGGQWKSGTGWSARAGLGLFDFKRVEARLNPAGNPSPDDPKDYNDSAPLVRTRGNTMFNIAGQSNPNGAPVWGIASKFRVLDLNGAAEYTTPELWRFGAQGDYLNNIGYDRDEIAGRIGLTAATLPGSLCGAGAARLDCKRTKGWRIEFNAGRGLVDDEGSWTASFGMRHLERDAVPDGFTPGDYRLGGTDVKASFIGGSYAPWRNGQVSLRYVNAEGIDSPVKFRVGTWTLDLLSRF